MRFYSFLMIFDCNEWFLQLLATCPNDCSGHGKCGTIRDISLYEGYGYYYSNWDKESVTLCNCDDTYFGPDCSLSKCYANTNSIKYLNRLLVLFDI